MSNSRVLATLRRSVALVFLLGICAARIANGQVTNPPTIYNTIPNGLLNAPPAQPANVPSEGPEAYGFKELGDGLNLAPGNRFLTTVSVVMSDWACQAGSWFAHTCVTAAGPYTVEPGITVPTFSQPITMNIYASNGATPPEPGALLATLTKTFQIPYRPSASTQCTGADAGKWRSTLNGTCNNGVATTIAFDFTNMAILLPDQIMVGIAYNTSTAGYNPLGTNTACYVASGGCPYDSLNISTSNTATYTAIGSPINSDGIYVNYMAPAAARACSTTSPAAVGNAFLLDTAAGCWTIYHPEIEVNAALGPPSSYQLRYAANLAIGDSFINLTNGGSYGGDYNKASGDICANIYVIDPAQEVIACCSCPLTPGHLKTLSTKNDLVTNTLTPGAPTAVSVQILATQGSNCNASTVTAPNLAAGLGAWMTTPHITPAGTYTDTETTFSAAPLSADQLLKLTSYCGWIQANGSGYGVCKACKQGAQGAANQ